MVRSQIGMFIFLAALTVTVAAKTREVAESGPQRVSLLEVYSSESCSSCPPADRWVSTLADNPKLWKSFIPVVFHVDYWNYLDWKDSYSQHQMTDRQMAIAKTWKSPRVYTPSVILDSQEWSDWRSKSLPNTEKISSMGLKLSELSEGKFSITVKGLKKEEVDKFNLYVAVLGFDIHSKITDGENKGKTLVHNFIVLEWKKIALQSKPEGIFDFSDQMRSFKSKSPRLAVVGWIEKADSLEPLQSVGGYL